MESILEHTFPLHITSLYQVKGIQVHVLCDKHKVSRKVVFCQNIGLKSTDPIL